MNITENRTVVVKPVYRTREHFPKGHDGQFKYTGCYTTFDLPISSNTGQLVNIFKSNSEENAFEEALGMDKGSLSVYKPEKNYWKNFSVSLSKKELELDLNDAMNVLKYKLLKANKNHIIEGWENRMKPGIQYVIVDKGFEDENQSNLAKKRREAYKLLDALKTKKDKYNLLRILGERPDKNAKVEYFDAKLDEIIQQVTPIKGVKSIDDFLKAAKDPSNNDRILVLDALDAGLIYNDGTHYKLKDGEVILGRSLDAVTNYFLDPKHNEDKLVLIELLK